MNHQCLINTNTIPGIVEIILTGFGTAPDNTIITWTGDQEERIIGIVVVLDADTSQSMIKTAKERLSSFIPTDKKDLKRIVKAKKGLEKSLKDKFWHDDSTLTKHGKKVFDESKKAVKALSKIKSTETIGVIELLVNADKTLAQDAINLTSIDALNKNTESKDKTNKQMDKGLQAQEKGKYGKAIDHFKKAWEQAQKFGKYLGDD